MKSGILPLLALCAMAMTVVACSSAGTTAGTQWDITDAELSTMLSGNDEIYLIDVRTAEEYETSHIPTAVNIPVDTIGTKAASLIPLKDRLTVVYCASGKRATTAKAALVELGYGDVRNFGKISSWTGSLRTGSEAGVYAE